MKEKGRIYLEYQNALLSKVEFQVIFIFIYQNAHLKCFLGLSLFRLSQYFVLA